MKADRPLLRWSSALTLVIALHVGAVAATLSWASQQPPAAPPPAAMMVELAPLPAAPPPQEKPAPKPPETPPPKPPEPVKPRKVETPKPRPRPKPAEIALPKPETIPELPPPAPAPAAASAPTPAPAPAPAAPAAGPLATNPASNALPSWQGVLLAHLEKHKRYPRAAQARRQQGVVYVAFAIDRQGNVLAHRLHQSSGYPALDQETLDLLQRAQPLPPPPADVSGERIELLVPVQFFLR